MSSERTHYEAVLDIRYAQRYFLLQERLFRRAAGLLKFLTLFSGTAAFAGAMSSRPDIAATAAVIIGALTILEHVLSPTEKAMQCNEAHRRYVELDRKALRLKLPQIEECLLTLRELPAPCIESLRMPAYNQSLLEYGRSDCIHPLSWWQRLMSAVT